MKIRAVVVGIDHFDDLTYPFVVGLHEYNPDLDIILIDNESNPPYPDLSDFQRLDTVRVERMGYGAALNRGAFGTWDWLLTCNNDCLSKGSLQGLVQLLRTDTIYGNAWKFDYAEMSRGLPAVADSAFMLIPRRIWDRIGGFDPALDAAFEEIDLQIRALDAGFRVDVAFLPIVHLNAHTRHELPDYQKRWADTHRVFVEKYASRMREENVTGLQKQS